MSTVREEERDEGKEKAMGGGEYDKNVLYALQRCHNETHCFYSQYVLIIKKKRN
jgi:hypothetical protein